MPDEIRPDDKAPSQGPEGSAGGDNGFVPLVARLPNRDPGADARSDDGPDDGPDTKAPGAARRMTAEESAAARAAFGEPDEGAGETDRSAAQRAAAAARRIGLGAVADWFDHPIVGPMLVRARALVAANLNQLIERAEDPARMMRLHISEMEDVLAELREGSDQTLDDLKRLRRLHHDASRDVAEWGERAEQMVALGHDDHARRAIEQRGVAEESLAAIEADMVGLENLLDQYRADIALLQQRLSEARERQAALAARIEGGLERGRRELDRTSVLGRFAALEAKVDAAEARAATWGERTGMRPADKKLDEELAAMKAAIARRRQGEKEE